MRRIKLRRKRNRNVWGYAYPVEYRIDLDPDLQAKSLMEIASHEVCHVVFPHLDESSVDLLGKQIADVLWRLKFRQED
jgi:hypothetical protein